VTTNEPTLRLHDNTVDGWVEYLQELLNGYNFGPLAVDGNFGPATQGAVMKFQGTYGLLVDGVVGNQTWAALRHETPQAPSTDGRAPHSYTEQGEEARWWTEVGPAAYDATQDTLELPAVNTGNTPISGGVHVADAKVTDSAGTSTDIQLPSFTQTGNPAQPGEMLLFGGTGISTIGTGPLHIDATLPAVLGSDTISVDITV